jgi:hypothetical protein
MVVAGERIQVSAAMAGPAIPRPRFRYRLRSLCVLIGLAAVVLGVIAAPGDHVAVALMLFPILAFELFAVYVLLVAAPFSVYLRLRRLSCPLCGQRTMRCRALVLFFPPLVSVHRCRNCGMTLERRLWRGWKIWMHPDEAVPSLTPGYIISGSGPNEPCETAETVHWPPVNARDLQVCLRRRSVEI